MKDDTSEAYRQLYKLMRCSTSCQRLMNTAIGLMLMTKLLDLRLSSLNIVIYILRENEKFKHGHQGKSTQNSFHV